MNPNLAPKTNSVIITNSSLKNFQTEPKKDYDQNKANPYVKSGSFHNNPFVKKMIQDKQLNEPQNKTLSGINTNLSNNPDAEIKNDLKRLQIKNDSNNMNVNQISNSYATNDFVKKASLFKAHDPMVDPSNGKKIIIKLVQGEEKYDSAKYSTNNTSNSEKNETTILTVNGFNSESSKINKLSLNENITIMSSKGESDLRKSPIFKMNSAIPFPNKVSENHYSSHNPKNTDISSKLEGLQKGFLSNKNFNPRMMMPLRQNSVDVKSQKQTSNEQTNMNDSAAIDDLILNKQIPSNQVRKRTFKKF